MDKQTEVIKITLPLGGRVTCITIDFIGFKVHFFSILFIFWFLLILNKKSQNDSTC